MGRFSVGFFFFNSDLEIIFWLIGRKIYEAMVPSINLSWSDKSALKAGGWLGLSAGKPLRSQNRESDIKNEQI